MKLLTGRAAEVADDAYRANLRARVRQIGSMPEPLRISELRSLSREDRGEVAEAAGLRPTASLRVISHHCARNYEHTAINW